MGKIRNILFVTIACLGLCSSLLHVTSGMLFEGYEVKERTQLEGRVYQSAPKLGLQSFVEGAYQQNVDSFLSDHIPKRDGVVLANAGLQRYAIELANLPFGYEAFHSYYGSSRVVLPKHNAIVLSPAKTKPSDTADMQRRAEALTKIANRHPSIQWCVGIVDYSDISAANPAHDLVSTPLDYDQLKEGFLNKLPDEITAVDLSISDPETYFERFFHTDHHWQIVGAIEAYSKIAYALDLNPINPQVYKAFSGPFYGSNDRLGRFNKYSDVILDAEFEVGKLKVTVNGKAEKASWLDAKYADNGSSSYRKQHKYENCYGAYFHHDYALLHIENESINSNKSILIVGDSFTNNMETLFACHYRNVYVADPRHFERDGYQNWSLDDFLIDNGIEAVVFVGYMEDLWTAIDRLS